jgi:ribonuclease J
MRVRIHRGSCEVGGSCVEVDAGGYRLVLDVGKPLSAGWDEHVPLPAVPGLAGGDDPSLLGLFVPHLDHYGLIDQVSPRVPVYVGAGAAAIVNAARFFSPSGPALRADAHLRHEVPISLGPFTITPYLVDHSAYDSYALLIDAGGRRLLYTGDLRGHGRKSSLFDRMLADPPPDIDTLLLEGTHVDACAEPDADADRYAETLTETEVELAMAATFRATVGLPVVIASAQNIDRLVTVYRAARLAGRTLLVDLYTAAVAQSTGRSTIPQPGFPGLGVYVPERQRMLVKRTGEFHRTRAIQGVRVYPEQLLASPTRYVVLTGSSSIPELVRTGAVRQGVAVWSMWTGYLDEPSGIRLRAELIGAGVPLIEHHTSGHAPVADLKRLVTALKPTRVVPIHTDGAAAYIRHFPTSTPHTDGEWWAV